MLFQFSSKYLNSTFYSTCCALVDVFSESTFLINRRFVHVSVSYVWHYFRSTFLLFDILFQLAFFIFYVLSQSAFFPLGSFWRFISVSIFYFLWFVLVGVFPFDVLSHSVFLFQCFVCQHFLYPRHFYFDTLLVNHNYNHLTLTLTVF